MDKRKLILAIIDGLGISNKKQGNAFYYAKTPFLDHLLKNDYPKINLKAAGQSVGLPQNQIGNSEVGHLSIGAGELVYTGLGLINQEIISKNFFSNKKINNFIDQAIAKQKKIHIMGLFSNGGVHSHNNHLFALLDLIKSKKAKINVYFHFFGDGRDVLNKSFKKDLINFQKKYLKNNSHWKIASLCGRFYAMDRDQIFARNELFFQALTCQSKNHFHDPIKYIESQYEKDIFDEFIEPAYNQNYLAKLQANDHIIFYNFRPDRARQIVHLLVNSKIYQYQAKQQINNLNLLALMKYPHMDNIDYVYKLKTINHPLGKIIDDFNLKQLRIAETQKYAHVTFFLDGGKNLKLKHCDQILIPSKKVDNFALFPEMSCQEIVEKLISVLEKYDFVVMNLANPDMVGHTGDFKATVKAIEKVDQSLEKLFQKTLSSNHTMFITSDHGNAETMIDDQKNIVTTHTTNDVFFISTNKNIIFDQKNIYSLINITPTILKFFKIDFKTKAKSFLIENF